MQASLLGPGLVACAVAACVQAAPPVPPGPPQAPIVRLSRDETGDRSAQPAADGTVLWEIGEWTDEEQLFLERINRARMFPLAETGILRDLADSSVQTAYTFFKVDFTVMSNHMATLPPVPPLAPHRLLLEAARGHSRWMFDNVVQSHFDGTGSVSNRVASVGYPLSIVGENIYAYSENPEYGHAGMEVDWGFPDAENIPKPPGMQNPPGHRLNNHEVRFREAGIGLHRGSNSRVEGGVTNSVGPQIYTVNFGDRPGAAPLVTGVVYFDLDLDGAYDMGEGIGGLRVDVDGSAYHSVSSRPGGYAVPASNGARTVRITGPGLSPVQRTVTVTGNANVKLDLPLRYTPPTLSGPANPPAGLASAYQPSAVPGATAFEWWASRRLPANEEWNAEAGLVGVIANVSPGYAVQDARYKADGAFCYRLTTPQPVDQLLYIDRAFAGGASPTLEFKLLLGYATPFQSLHAEVSDDGGSTWRSVWSRAGVTGQTDSGFTTVSVPLAGMANRQFRVRFRYSVALGPYYNTTFAGEGAHLDEIRVMDAYVTSGVATGTAAAGTPIQFTPPSTGEYVIDARPILGNRSLPRGVNLVLNAVVAPPSLRIATPVLEPNRRLRLDFTLESGSGGAFILQRSTSPMGPWTTDAGATLTANSATSHTFRTTFSGDEGYYRVRMP